MKKRILSFSLSVLMLFSAFILAASAEGAVRKDILVTDLIDIGDAKPYHDIHAYYDVYGDLNQDHTLNTADYVLAKRYVLGTLEMTDTIWIILDVNEDRKCNVADYVMIKRVIMGTLDHFPAAEDWYD